MNGFSSTQDSGLLKKNYDSSGVSEVLKRKREKLAQTRIGLEPSDDDKEDSDG